MCERVPIRQAAKEIGCTPSEIRKNMIHKRDGWDLGAVRKNPKGSKQEARVWIFRDKLDKFLGKKLTEGQA